MVTDSNISLLQNPLLRSCFCGNSTYWPVARMSPRSSIHEDRIELLEANYVIFPGGLESRASIDRKVSTPSPGKCLRASNTVVHELLECSICVNIMFPPIHQCPNGHTLCSKCKSKLQNCPICRQGLGNIRCLVLERVAELLDVPCQYQGLGCQEIFPYNSKLRHEKHCRFRPYSCPYGGDICPVTGAIPDIMGHLLCEHRIDMHFGCHFNHRYVKSTPFDVDNASWMLRVFHCHEHYFCLHFEAFHLGTVPVYMAFIRFIGEDEDARRFAYMLEVGGGGRRMTWQGIPRSIRHGYADVRDSLDGLIIHRDMALLFSGGDRRELKLKMSGCIWRVGGEA